MMSLCVLCAFFSSPLSHFRDPLTIRHKTSKEKKNPPPPNFHCPFLTVRSKKREKKRKKVMAYNTRSSARSTTRSSASTVAAGRKTHTGRKTAVSKPASKRTVGGRAAKSTATKKKAPATHHKRKPSIGDKIAGVVLKVEGAITGRPGVKVFALLI